MFSPLQYCLVLLPLCTVSLIFLVTKFPTPSLNTGNLSWIYVAYASCVLCLGLPVLTYLPP
jgi:hypothetical protein